MHGIPDAPVDVVVDGAVVIEGFEPGTMQDISSFAGQTLTNVEVRAAGTDDVVIGPLDELAVPDSGNWTVVAHLQADGTPTLTPFENDAAPVAAGQGRLTVRHTAAAPAVDIVLADGSRPFTSLSNPERSRQRPCRPARSPAPRSHRRAATPSPTSRASTCRPAPNLIVYAVGSLDAGCFTFYTQTIGGLGGAPIAVNTGNSLPGDDDNGTTLVVLLVVAAGLFALVGTGLLVGNRRDATPNRSAR